MLSAVFVVFICICTSDALTRNYPNEDFHDGSNSRNIKEEEDEVLSSDRQNSANHFADTLPGDPAIDYPTYTDIPRTGFSCEGKVNWRYYADIETDCQVFHVCETEYSKISFVCPIGSIFNQRHLVCDWWYNFECNDAVALYTLSNGFNEEQLSEQVEEADDRRGFDLSPASSGGNADLSEGTFKLKNAPSLDETKLKSNKRRL